MPTLECVTLDNEEIACNTDCGPIENYYVI